MSRKKISVEQILNVIGDFFLFQSEDGTPHVSWTTSGILQTWPINDQTVAQEIQNRVYERFGKLAEKNIVINLTELLGYKARRNSSRLPVFNRVGKDSEVVWIDLVGKVGDGVAFQNGEWSIETIPKIHFVRPPGSMLMPAPSIEGSIEELRQFLNLASEDDFWLVVSFIVVSLMPATQYPVLILQGLQGTAKSTTSRILKLLIDPGKPPLRNPSKSEQDLFVAARNCHLLAIDNLSGLANWMSDALCRLSTGGGFSSRQLYSNGTEFTIDVAKPTLINGIDELGSRGDLASRAIMIHLPALPEDKRIDESSFWKSFEQSRPKIMSALFSSIAYGLNCVDSVPTQGSHRMVDFARFACACLGYFEITPDQFNEFLRKNANEIALSTLELSPVGRSLVHFMFTQSLWRGSISELRDELYNRANSNDLHGYDWPRSIKGFSIELQRLTPTLAKDGIIIERRRLGNERQITITNTFAAKNASHPSYPSQQRLNI